MKKIFIISIFLSMFFISNVYMKEFNNKLIGKRIIIDIGHGGKDSGAIYKNIKEKDLNLQIGIKLKQELIKNGVDVLLVREGDYDLSLPDSKRRKKSDFDNRIKLINNSESDLYISIHMNFLDSSKYYGAQVFYTKSNQLLALEIQDVFIDELKSPLKARELLNDIYMYKKLKIPGVLIECGFLSNDKERKLLLDDDYQNMLVNSIVKGLINYY